MSDVDTAAPDETGHPGRSEATGFLGDLARRRDQIRNEQRKDVTVPRWSDPELHVVFRPIPHEALRHAAREQEKAAKQRNIHHQTEVEINTNADLLIEACEEVYAVLSDGTETGVGPGGIRTRFDQDLAISLGLPPAAGARAVCRQLFITDGDLLAVAREVGEWSGYREDAVDSELAGESRTVTAI